MHYPQSTLSRPNVLSQYCAKPCRNTELASAVELPSFLMRAVPKGSLGEADTTRDPTIPQSQVTIQAEQQAKSCIQPFSKLHTEMKLWSQNCGQNHKCKQLRHV